MGMFGRHFKAIAYILLRLHKWVLTTAISATFKIGGVRQPCCCLSVPLPLEPCSSRLFGSLLDRGPTHSRTDAHSNQTAGATHQRMPDRYATTDEAPTVGLYLPSVSHRGVPRVVVLLELTALDEDFAFGCLRKRECSR